MKSKHTAFRLIVALLTIAVGLYCGEVWAQQQEATKDQVPVVEFSNNLDRQAVGGGGSINGLDPLQVLYTEPPDAVGVPRPWDTFDFGETGEVDALANGGDLYFYEVTGNTASLLVSFQGDPGLNAVWFETPPGATGIQWTQINLNNPNPADELEDLDGLEVHGPLGADDAEFYSLLGDPGGVSVFYWAPPAGPSTPYIPQAVIQTAVEDLGYAGPPVDLDGLMIFEAGGVLGDKEWGAGDRIIFSIRLAGNWDGGEIVVLPFGGAAAFLNHGGHVWNTAFGVAAAFGVSTEEVDAVEAIRSEGPVPTPALTEWGLVILVVLLLASAVFIFLRRKKVMVSP